MKLFKRKSKTEAKQLTPDEQVAYSKVRLAEANNREAELRSRSTKWNGRAIVGVNVFIGVFFAFELTMLGYDIAKGETANAIRDALFVLMFGLMLAGSLADVYADAKMGRRLRTSLTDLLERIDILETARKEKCAKEQGCPAQNTATTKSHNNSKKI